MLLLFQQGSSDFATFTCCILPIIFLIFIIVMSVKQANENKAREQAHREKRNKKLEELKPIARTSVGKYLAGLPNVSASYTEIDCAVLENDFVFINAYGAELDKIPRDSINQIIVDDKSKITQRLTVTRIVALGVFALAAPKAEKHQTFCLVIDWDDDKGVRQNTVFEFTGETSSSQANGAANTLKKYTKPKAERLKSNEKKCPFCAETIKREAKICRFCKSELPDEPMDTHEVEAVASEENVRFQVVLQSAGGNVINVIKAIREITGLGLKESKDLVDSAPSIVSEGISKSEAEEIRQMLEDAGATVELR